MALPRCKWQVSVRAKRPRTEPGVVSVTHDGRVALEMPSATGLSPTNRPTDHNQFYGFDNAYDQDSRPEELYYGLVRPLVDFLFVGQSSMVMFYGQVRGCHCMLLPTKKELAQQGGS